MRTRSTLGLIAALAIALPLATAQTADPTVNETDLNTTAPPPDDSYLNDTNSTSPSDNSTGDPTLSSSDFNTTAPTADTSYLDDGSSPAASSTGTAAGASSGAAQVPAPDVAVALCVTALAALALRRR